MRILLAPHVSEKSTLATDRNNQHVFRVLPDATKDEIKGAVELLFDVKVDAVRTANIGGKRKRFGARRGRRGDWKKAYVRLQSGHDIEFAGER